MVTMLASFKRPRLATQYGTCQIDMFMKPGRAGQPENLHPVAGLLAFLGWTYGLTACCVGSASCYQLEAMSTLITDQHWFLSSSY